MAWKRFQWVIWALLAVCAGGIVLLLLIDGLLVIGPVDSADIFGILLLLAVLTLMVWGDAALARASKGWVRGIALAFTLAAEGLALAAFLFFGVFFYTSPDYIPLYGPTGEVELVVREEKWLFKVWGEFYKPAGSFLIRSTGVTYEAHDIWPFADERYELEWEEDKAVIRYDTGAGTWETCVVPLD